MATQTRLSDFELRSLVEPILRDRLRKYGFKQATVTSGEDYYGDPILEIVIFYKNTNRIPENLASIDAVRAVRGALLAEGESRFPIIIGHRFPEDPSE